MIHKRNNDFSVGSPIPKRLWKEAQEFTLPEVAQSVIEAYVRARGWTAGEGLVFVGHPGSGKTTAMLKVAHLIHAEVSNRPESNFWTERDFLNDLKNLQRLENTTSKVSKDEGLWHDYLLWERDFWRYKQSPVLLFDDVGQGYTPWQAFEVEGLYRLRDDEVLGTVTTMQKNAFDNLTDSFKSILTRRAIVVPLNVSY